MNKKIPVLIMVIGVLLLIPSTAFGHKLIPTNGSNDSLENGLMISDHKISFPLNIFHSPIDKLYSQLIEESGCHHLYNLSVF